MIDSAIQNLHFYYALVFSSPAKTIQDVIKYFGDNIKTKKYELIPSFPIYHIQREFDTRYGSINLLQKNMDSQGNIWYDFYVTSVLLNEKLFFIVCYPYKILETTFLLNRHFSESFKDVEFYNLSVEMIIALKKGNLKNTKVTKEISEKISIDIIKYSASITESSTKRVHLVGTDPINSSVYDLLMNGTPESKIELKPLSLKLKCQVIDIGEIELSFDGIGNYRFWIKKGSAGNTISTLVPIFQYFKALDAFSPSKIKNRFTFLIENENE